MTGVEIFLLLAGLVFMIGSFFVTEKLSPSELKKIARISEGELKNIINRGLEGADARIEEAVEGQIAASIDKTERALEKETNEKIMAINEYSDTVIENMNKTHSEIMFLYNMLNDKHTELVGLASDLHRLTADVRNVQERVAAAAAAVSAAPQEKSVPEKASPVEAAEQQTEPAAQTEASETGESEDTEKENHNKEILILHKKGMSDVEIARQLGLGLGEVKLVIGLYKGDANS